MPISPEELERRLERADHQLRKLRRATLEMRELGREIRSKRKQRGSLGSGRGRARGR